MVASCIWETKVKADTEIVLIYSPHHPGLPAPPNSPKLPPKLPPTVPEILIHSASVLSSISAKPLEREEDIWTAKGPCRLPFLDCGDRVFTFWDDPGGNAGFEEFHIFRNVRERAPPGRWCDQDGNVIQGGCVAPVANPGVSIGPALAGRIPELQGLRCRYVVFEGGTLTKTGQRMKEDHGHLDGDLVYRWNVYPSQQRGRAGVVEAMKSPFSIGANWPEVSVKGTLDERFICEKVTEKHLTDWRDTSCAVSFAIIGLRSKTE